MHACTSKQAQRWSHQCGTETWSRSCYAARRVRDATKSVTPACSRGCVRNASGTCLVVSRWRSAWISSGIQTHCKAANRGAPMAWCVLSRALSANLPACFAEITCANRTRSEIQVWAMPMQLRRATSGRINTRPRPASCLRATQAVHVHAL